MYSCTAALQIATILIKMILLQFCSAAVKVKDSLLHLQVKSSGIIRTLPSGPAATKPSSGYVWLESHTKKVKSADLGFD